MCITHLVPDFIGAIPLFGKRGGWGVSHKCWQKTVILHGAVFRCCWTLI